MFGAVARWIGRPARSKERDQLLQGSDVDINIVQLMLFIIAVFAAVFIVVRFR